MTDSDQQRQPETPERAGDPKQPVRPEASPFAGLFRAFKMFLVPFLFSWALAYVGSARDVEWIYFAGLGGVTVSMLALLVWLIH